MPASHREINEFRARIFGVPNRVVAFVCECAEPGCRRAVRLTRDEYDDLRANEQTILFPGHDAAEETPLTAERAWLAQRTPESRIAPPSS